MEHEFKSDAPEGIAIIGMAGRFPGANSIDAFWENLKNGVESITKFSAEELAEAGLEPQTIQDPDYVAARGTLPHIDELDAAFFGMTAKEAEMTDPQHRNFLEIAWQTMEQAGYDPSQFAGSIGVYAGMSRNTYFLNNLLPNRDTMPVIDTLPVEMGNEKDYLATRISYKLGLTGPSVNVSTACSTSLVAIYHASEALLNFQCDMALAGGVSIKVPQASGYWYEEGSIGSPDGHCRSYDAKANGTVFSNAIAMIALKRLEDALNDGDQIYAVIRGIAINNDGDSKVNFGAPSINGQAEAIVMAHQFANVDPATIGYVEGHGTATPLGDPIEVAALTQAFRAGTDATQFCALGSVKSNIGHTDAAAGVTGLIKTALSLYHKQLPPSLHFEEPNPKLGLANSPFYVNTSLQDWSTTPRRAGVSAFGTGGTNAHAVLEEAPTVMPSVSRRTSHILLLSARTESALEKQTANLIDFFRTNPYVYLADVAYTLQVGRRRMPYRRVVVCQNVDDAIAKLSASEPNHRLDAHQERQERRVAFMFPGQGSQYVNMGHGLYESEPTFKDAVDECAAILEEHIGRDIRDILYPAAGQEDDATHELTQTAMAQPAIFIVSYAMAQLWLAWGIQPSQMIGHSVGEFVAACLAGVFSLEDALHLLSIRGRLIQSLPAGNMLAVGLDEETLLPLIDAHSDLSIGVINSPGRVVVSGTPEAVAALELTLTEQDVSARHLHTSHAFHSPMMDPILDEFTREVSRFRLNQPIIPFISSPTGTWITDAEATDPAYWARHLREPVRFSDGRTTLASDLETILLEVGPGNTLTTLANHPSFQAKAQIAISSMGHPNVVYEANQSIAAAVGQLWLAGVKIDWSQYHADESCRRLSLPTYPFERQKFWISPPVKINEEVNMSLSSNGNSNGISHKLHGATIATDLSASISNINLSRIDMPQSAPPAEPVVTVSRLDKIRRSVDEVLFDIGGLEPHEIITNATFLDLGFDSLFLTQASTALRKKFGIKVTFRQLMEETSTTGTLVAFLDEKLPQDQFMAEMAEPVHSVTPTVQQATASHHVADSGQAHYAMTMPTMPPVTMPAPSVQPMAQPLMAASADATTVERIIQLQLQQMQSLMTAQLQMVAGQPGQVMQPQAIPAVQMPAVQVVPTQTQSIPATTSHPLPSPEAVSGTASTSKLGEESPISQESDSKSGTSFGPWKPLNKSADDDLTPVQRQFTQELVANFTTKTAKSKSMTAQYRDVHADPRAVSGFKVSWKEMIYPIVVERSGGSHLWDVDGNEYIDMQSGFGSSLFGHSPEFVTKALQAQLDRGVHIGPQMDTAGETAEKISKLVGHERVTFCNTGSEAVMAAMRIARTVKGRDLVATFSGDYHGQFNEVLVRGVVRRGETRTLPIAPGIPAQSVENMLLLDFGNPESFRILNERADEIAAVLVEPVQSRHPNVQPKEFLQQLRAWTTENDVCLIFDEVITGFRLAPGGAQAWYNIQADMASYGKVIGGGMPIGVLAGKREFMDALDGGQWAYGDQSVPEVGVTYFAGTFVRHPLVVAAANAVADHLLAQPTLQAELNERAVKFADQLNQIFVELSAPMKVEHCGSMLYLAFHEPKETDELFYFTMRSKGIHIMSARAFFLTTAHSDDDLNTVCAAVRETTQALQAAGFLSSNGVAQTETAPALEVGGTQRPFPLTDDQSGLWLASQLSELSNCAYNESILLNLSGPLNAELMQRAVTEAIQRHDSYFLQFAADGMSQRVSAERTLDIRSFDFTNQPDPTASLAQLVETEAKTPFDLEHGPLVRVNFVQMGEKVWRIHFVAHHIATDGFSSSVLVEEIRSFYQALIHGETVEIGPATSFQQYAEENALLAQSNDGQESLQYWLTELAELPDPLHLPGDRSRPARKSYQGDAVKWGFDAEVIAGVRDAARSQKSTMFNFLLSAFNAFLMRLTGQNDIVVGVPMAGQVLYDMMDLTGFCVHFLPLRTRIEEGESFADLLQRTQSKMMEGREFQPCALGNIIRAMNLPHDASRTPITDIAFNLDRPVSQEPVAGVEMTLDVAAKKAVAWDLFFNLTDTGETIIADCDYNTDILDGETVTRWLESFQTLLREVIRQVEQPVARIQLLTEQERRQILVDWNQTEAPYRRDICLHQLFEEQAQRTPDAVAAIFPNQELTYGELRERANRLANYLRVKGANAGTLVGIYIDRSPEMLVGVLGTMIAGAAYVPLDPNYPQERLAYIVDDAKVTLLLTSSNLEASLPQNQAQVIRLDQDWPLISQQSSETPSNVNTSEDVAFVVYTSGSTGKPKGVMANHRSHVGRAQWMWDTYPFVAGEVCCQKTSLNFIDHSWEIYGPLLAGVPSVYIPDSVVKQPIHFLETLVKYQVTRLILVPAHMSSLLDSFNDLGQRLPHLWLWTASGEAVTVELARQFQNQLPDRKLLNLYGMSEVAIDVTAYELEDAERLSSVPIGQPVANAKAYILDSTYQPVPVGVVGEIYVGGEILSNGYLFRPDLTNERFLPNPFMENSAGGSTADSIGSMGSRMYKTGDLGRYRADGMIEYVGRADHQIKIRGFRVELGEVEATLLTHEGVQQCVVMARTDLPGGTQLIGYVLSAEQVVKNPVTADELKHYLRRTLPDYMVPTHLMILPAFPLTPNGKVNRIALLATPLDDVVEQPYVAPRNPLEEKLVEMWQALLGVESIGIQDDFFDRGGHSLLAVRLFAQIRDLTGDNLPLSVLFDSPTIEGLAQILSPLPLPESEPITVTDGWSPIVMINKGDIGRTPFFCIHGGGGNVLIFRELSKHMGAEIPFYGLEARGANGILRPHTTIEEMADCYLQAIRTVQATGPYHLGGYSGGGVVAYEIAGRLRQRGEDVAVLALIDTFRPGIHAKNLSIGSHVKNFSAKGTGYLADRLKERTESRRLEKERREAVEKALAENAVIPIEVRDWYLTTNFIAALERYTPKVYNGEATIFSASDLWEIYSHVGNDRGWYEVMPKLKVQIVPGDHDTLVRDDNVKMLARKLSELLNAS